MSAWVAADLARDVLLMAPRRIPIAAPAQVCFGPLPGLAEGPGLCLQAEPKTNCRDTAPAEIFFPTVETGLIHPRRLETREQAKQAIFEYFEVFHHRQRNHSAPGYRTLAVCEQLHRRAA